MAQNNNYYGSSAVDSERRKSNILRNVVDRKRIMTMAAAAHMKWHVAILVYMALSMAMAHGVVHISVRHLYHISP